MPVLCVGVGLLLAVESKTTTILETQAGNAGRDIAKAIAEPALAITASVVVAHAGAGANAPTEIRINLATLEHARQQLAGALSTTRDQVIAAVDTDDSLMNTFRVWAVRSAYDGVLGESAEHRLRVIDVFINQLRARATADSSVGIDDVGEVIAAEYLRPRAKEFARATFRETALVHLCRIPDARLCTDRRLPQCFSATEA